jgi:putative ABC transport system permease protein
MMRSNVEPDGVIPELRHVVADLDVELPLLRVMSMDGVIETQRNGNPLFTRMMATFAFLALMLAGVGIYGLIAYSVSQRTQEIGIRLALGAKESDISWMILREGLKIAAIGSGIGLVLALPLPKVFDSIFTGIPMGAPEVYPIVLAAMLLVAMIATLVPARRAVKVDPSAALRSE